MSQVAIVIDVPNYPVGILGELIDVGNEAARLVRKQFPIANDSTYPDQDDPPAQTALSEVVTTGGTVVVATTADIINPAFTSTTAAGGAAGDITVTGVDLATSVVVSVVAIKDADQSVLDLTDEFEVSADDTINNTGGTATTGYHLAVVWHDGSV